MREARFTPRLSIVECEGHGRYFEVDDAGQYVGTFEPDGVDLCRRFAGRIALLYTFDDYDRECAERIAADPHGFDLSDVEPAPHLVMVRPPEVIA